MRLTLPGNESVRVRPDDELRLLTATGNIFAFRATDTPFVVFRPNRDEMISDHSWILETVTSQHPAPVGARGLLLLDKPHERAGTVREPHLFFLYGHGQSMYLATLIAGYLNDEPVYGSTPS